MDPMSRSFKDIVDHYLLLGGTKEEICAKAGISYSSLAHALAPKRRMTLKPKNIVRVALACNLTEEEALALARTGASKGKRIA